MQSRTKIVVFHMKSLILTGLFVLAGLLLIFFLFLIFYPGDSTSSANADVPLYTPGVYNTTLTLNGMHINMEVALDADHINAIHMTYLDDSITTMYPLLQPAFEDIRTQVYDQQALTGISCKEDQKYTSYLLLQAIQSSLAKACPAQ